MTKLKECPFCGSYAKIVETGDSFYVSCWSCPCIFGMTGSGRGEFTTKEEAAERWDDRLEIMTDDDEC